MDSNGQPRARVAHRWADILCSCAWGVFAAGSVYVLSFGPMQRLTCTVLDGSSGTLRVARQAPFPGWCRWTTVVYRPLMAVRGGQEGRLALDILSWYVDLWM
jgi:hypothetical protein